MGEWGDSRTRATIQDVANAAGVTKGTVSKYLNRETHGYYVAVETRARIEAAIKELQFEPSTIAQGLSGRSTRTLGVVLADLRDAFYPELIAGIQEVTDPLGFSVLLGVSGGDPTRERALLRSFALRRVDAVVLASLRIDGRDIRSIESSGVRMVLVGRDIPGLHLDTVIADNRAGAQVATQHLVQHGHRRIAHIGGPASAQTYVDRLDGYRDALRSAGLPADAALIRNGHGTPEGARVALAELLAEPDPPTAVFVASDHMALGVLAGSRDLGVKVPQRVAIVGFDNVPSGRVALSPLTTVDSHAEQQGRRAAQLLLARNGEARGTWVLDAHLVTRESCGCSAAPSRAA